MEDNIIFLKFADSKVPEMKEVKSGQYVAFGEDNAYPDHLLYLYNKSSKHNAIINGKVNYVYGKGLVFEGNDAGRQLLKKCNRYGETLGEVTHKATIDCELFGGYYLQVIWNAMGYVGEIYHLPFQHIRKSTSGGYLYKKDWKNNREKPVPYAEFDPNNKKGAQIFCFKEYRPGTDVYPLPGYMGSLNYIETDIEISKYHLSAIRNGMFPSKMIVMNNGEPNEEGKRKIEKGFKNKFGGSENAGTFMLVYNTDPAKAPIIQDLSATELDKQFTILNETVQQEIFSGHGITTPALFGIATAGKLGEANQLREGYDIFRRTYAELKQSKLEESINYLTAYAGAVGKYTLTPVDPIGFTMSEAGLLQVAPKEWLLEQLNIDPTKYPSTGIAPGGSAGQMEAPANENLKNLTGRQYQQVMRVVREFAKGKLTQEQATVMLKGGLGLTDDDIAALLGLNQQEAFAALPYTEEQVAEMFAECGHAGDDYLVIDSWAFGADNDQRVRQAFADAVTITDMNILEIIKESPTVGTEEIARALRVNRETVARKVADMVSRGILEQRTTTNAEGVEVIERKVVNDGGIPGDVEPTVTEVAVRYTYEKKPGVSGPAILPDGRTRPFCKRLVELGRMYSAADIERITERVGYSVFDRAGGFWMQPDGTVSPSCRHYWKTNVVIRRKKK